MRIIPEVGDQITLKKFCFNDKDGGTGLSNWEFNEKYSSPVTVTVIKEWNDEECGQRGWALPDKNDKSFIEYLKRNAREGHQGFVIYWSEFDIINTHI